MIAIKLNDRLQKKGVTLYWLAKNSGVPYVTLWNMSQKKTQDSISLPVLSRLCTALGCAPGDLLHHLPDEEDKAIATLIKIKEGDGKPVSEEGRKAKGAKQR
jgi:DNA-binding Xre family transcriptional regulator